MPIISNDKSVLVLLINNVPLFPIRKRSTGLIIDALSAYVSAGFDHFFFVDNTFNLPSGYSKDLCDQMLGSGLNITWRGILYPWKVEKELVAKMAESGCVEVSLGLESGSDT